MTPQVKALIDQISLTLPHHKSVQAAAQHFSIFMQSVMGPLPPDFRASIDEAVKAIEASLQSVEILRRNSLIKVRENWYQGPSLLDQHWSALKGYLENTKHWNIHTTGPIDESSTEVVSLLANPKTDQFRCRGLVVGYVQSGKTANMTAVIAKAVDAGYNLIIVLGGVTNKLRQQTQRRLQEDIIDRHPGLWQLHTTDDENGDFISPANNGQFTMPVEGRAQLAVIKKEASRLASLLEAITNTPAIVKRTLKTLIIDDECDQASVNAGKTETDITEINKAIRKIIRGLPAVSYVGYTATPFANVFINPFPAKKDELDDLYPEDFITALPRPNNYFGALEVFGYDPDDADNDEGASAGRDMVRAIPPAEVPIIRSAKNNKAFIPQMTDSLESAILWFVISCSLRRRRGHADEHMSMLVHTSQLVLQHDQMAEIISAWFAANASSIKDGAGSAWDKLVNVWQLETARVPLNEEHGESNLQPIDLKPYLEAVLDAINVAVENGDSDRRLNYNEEHTEDKDKVIPKTYIVVGGSILARGLTLEGLSVSFFLRTSKQYDTLLQMGRWFGFRNGYEDLPRLWATQDLIANFRALARIEEEIRGDISQYKSRNATPLDFAVKVRAIPGLAITSAAKLRYAKKTSISFEGRHIQTIRFDHEKDGIVTSNWAAAKDLVDRAKTECDEYIPGKKLFKGVPVSVIRKFLKTYDICDKHLDLKQDMLLNYLDAAGDKLANWNLAVISPDGKPSNNPLGFLENINTNVRSRLKEPSSYADIKALMSKRDILVDADTHKIKKEESWENLKQRRPAVPLLLIYPIQAESLSKQKLNKHGEFPRVALNAYDDLIGFGIVFPGEKDHAGAFYAVELDVPTPEQLEDDELLEEVDAQ
jgi:hypothetical protein